MLDSEFVKLSRSHTEILEKYYRELFRNFTVHDLVKHEQILSDLIDDERVYDSLVIDDVMKMYELIRDECVRRVVMCCERV